MWKREGTGSKVSEDTEGENLIQIVLFDRTGNTDGIIVLGASLKHFDRRSHEEGTEANLRT